MDKPELTLQRLMDALLCCEHISSHEEDLPHNLKTDKERQLHSALTKIYRICHTARVPSCFDKHENWEKEFQEFIEIAK